MRKCLQYVCLEVLKFLLIGENTDHHIFTLHMVEMRLSFLINELEVLEGAIPSKQLKMLLGWAAFHQEELKENWELAEKNQELFSIEPLK